MPVLAIGDNPPMPRVVSANKQGLRFQNLFGELGPELYVTGHHTAGPKDADDKHCEQLIRNYHQQHANQGWGGCGYFACISRKGTIYLLRPTRMKGAHVGGHNTSNYGVMFHGTTGDRPTVRQRRSYAWLLKYAHTTKLPAAHRTDLDLRKAMRRGHKQWPGHSTNACPGTHLKMILSGGTAR